MARHSPSPPRRPSPALALLQAAVACVAAALLLPGARAGMTFEEHAIALSCVCTDVYPRESFLDAKVDYTCWEQSNFGSCKEAFMLQTPEEVPEGYCQISCGRCPCCPKLSEVLKSKGLNMAAWMFSFTDYAAQIAKPGAMTTLLAPEDGAVWGMLGKLGYPSKEAVEADAGAKDQIKSIALMHVLPPVKSLKAVWTTPFMRRGVQIPTALDNKTVTATQDEASKKVWLQAPKSGASIVERDIEACKGYVQKLDGVLIPWAMKGYE